MHGASPLNLLEITVAVMLAYGAIAWRLVIVPAQRRHADAQQRLQPARVQPAPRAQLRLVVDNSRR
ncbi:MAG: hypothetical protein JWM34_4762 [Ilumatobacteraceae bacterium]|nr:hypothetical protein [Ilumatobacteraceae bacterium]